MKLRFLLSLAVTAGCLPVICSAKAYDTNMFDQGRDEITPSLDFSKIRTSNDVRDDRDSCKTKFDQAFARTESELFELSDKHQWLTEQPLMQKGHGLAVDIAFLLATPEVVVGSTLGKPFIAARPSPDGRSDSERKKAEIQNIEMQFKEKYLVWRDKAYVGELMLLKPFISRMFLGDEYLGTEPRYVAESIIEMLKNLDPTLHVERITPHLNGAVQSYDPTPVLKIIEDAAKAGRLNACKKDGTFATMRDIVLEIFKAKNTPAPSDDEIMQALAPMLVQ